MEANDSLSLQLVLDFDGRKVRSEEDLALLPFASHFQHLERVYQAIRLAGFRGHIMPRERLLVSRSSIHFPTTIAYITKMGQVHLAERLQALYIEAKPQLEIVRNGSLLDISFDLSGIEQSEIDQAITALLNQEDHYTSPSGKVFVLMRKPRKSVKP